MKQNNPGCNCCGCRCDLVDCYTNDALDGQGCVNETEFVLANIPDSVEVWTYEGPNFQIVPSKPAYFYRYIIQNIAPNSYGPAVTAAAINGTYVYERGNDTGPLAKLCRFPFFSLSVPTYWSDFDLIANVERYVQNPFGSNSLSLIGTFLNESIKLRIIPIHDEAGGNLSLVGSGSSGLLTKPTDWYMHYHAVSIRWIGTFAGGLVVSNPIRPSPTAQATCGQSDLVWITEPFVSEPYPFVQSLDWSAYRNTYATGSTAESFP